MAASFFAAQLSIRGGPANAQVGDRFERALEFQGGDGCFIAKAGDEDACQAFRAGLKVDILCRSSRFDVGIAPTAGAVGRLISEALR